MAFFNEFPHARTYDDDLGWLLYQMRRLIETVNSLNEIKYADPINWSIARQYEKNTIVKDYNTGVLYLSKQPVPAGIPLTDDNYWLSIGNFDYQIEFLKQATSANDEGQAIYSTTEYKVNDLFWWNDKLYIATAPISAGDVLDAAANCAETTTGAQIGAILNRMPVHVKQHFRYYIDNVNGSDDNDGLSSETPFKTLTRFIKEGNKYSEIRAFLLTSGVYECSGIDIISNVSIHIQNINNTLDTTLLFNIGEEVSLACYNTHWNICGANNGKMTIEIDNNNHSECDMYFDNTLLAFVNVTFKQNARFYGSTLNAGLCTFKKLLTSSCFVNITDGVYTSNVDPTGAAFEFINTYGRMQGGINAAEMPADNTAELIRFNRASMYIGSAAPSNALQSKYATGMRLMNGSLIQMTQGNTTGTVNNNIEGFIRSNESAVLTDQGIQAPQQLRYNSNRIQQWTGTGWTTVLTP